VKEELRKIAAGLLLSGGAISVPEARKMAGLPALTQRQQKAYQQMYNWCKNTGVPMQATRPDYWAWSVFWSNDEPS